MFTKSIIFVRYALHYRYNSDYLSSFLQHKLDIFKVITLITIKILYVLPLL